MTPAAPTVARQRRRCDSAGATARTSRARPARRTPSPTRTSADAAVPQRGDGRAGDELVRLGRSSSRSSRSRPRGQALGPGDHIQQGFVRNSVESRCGAPDHAAHDPQAGEHLPLRHAAGHEPGQRPVCLVARTAPLCAAGTTPSIYGPAFAPGCRSPRTTWATPASPSRARVGVVALPAAPAPRSPSAAAGTVLRTTGSPPAPTRRSPARPTVAGSPAEGGTLTAAAGTWSGSPAYG